MEIKKSDNIITMMESTIKEAMEVMDRGAMGIVLVVDDNHMLRGTVTDGDVRRAILGGSDLNNSVDSVMHANFTYITEANATEENIRNIFSKKRIKQLPILSESKQPVGIVLIEDIISETQKDNLVFIMAGGMGTRLKPLTDDIPKPMLKVGDRPILETMINQFKKYGYQKFVISVNYKSHIIENYFQDGSYNGARIDYIREKKRLGTAGALSLIRDFNDKPFFVINGDVLTNLNFNNFLAYHIESGNDMTIASRSFYFQVPYGVINYKNDKISSIDEKPEMSFPVSGGIYILNPSLIGYIPSNRYFDMTDLINAALNGGKRIGVFPISEYWIDIGRIQEYNKANEDIYKYFGSEACATTE